MTSGRQPSFRGGDLVISKDKKYGLVQAYKIKQAAMFTQDVNIILLDEKGYSIDKVKKYNRNDLKLIAINGSFKYKTMGQRIKVLHCIFKNHR